jgi:hypothetical protein
VYIERGAERLATQKHGRTRLLDVFMTPHHNDTQPRTINIPLHIILTFNSYLMDLEEQTTPHKPPIFLVSSSSDAHPNDNNGYLQKFDTCCEIWYYVEFCHAGVSTYIPS